MKDMGKGKRKNASRLGEEELNKIHAYWRACNYLAAGMIYLKENRCSENP